MHFAGSNAKLRSILSSWALRSWYRPLPASLDPVQFLLLAASRLYGKALRARQRRASLSSQRVPAFVISIGNLVAGGTGKTPLTLWIARTLSEAGFKPAILSRGYGRQSDDVDRVAADGESTSQSLLFGDEPVLMARKAPSIPVWVGRKRILSGQAAIQQSGADVLLLDDGFQHTSLSRDVDLVLLDARNPFGNGALLPLGPLREPIDHMERADAIVLTRAGEDRATLATREAIRHRFPGKPVFLCRHALAGLKAGFEGPSFPLAALRDAPSIGFAGIARPETFFHALNASSIRLSACLAFPDHYHYTDEDIRSLLRALRTSGARFLITTEKDFVRLPAKLQQFTLAAELELEFGGDQPDLACFLRRKLDRMREQPADPFRK